jgi:hypothetical protein
MKPPHHIIPMKLQTAAGCAAPGWAVAVDLKIGSASIAIASATEAAAACAKVLGVTVSEGQS